MLIKEVRVEPMDMCDGDAAVVQNLSAWGVTSYAAVHHRMLEPAPTLCGTTSRAFAKNNAEPTSKNG